MRVEMRRHPNRESRHNMRENGFIPLSSRGKAQVAESLLVGNLFQPAPKRTFDRTQVMWYSCVTAAFMPERSVYHVQTR